MISDFQIRLAALHLLEGATVAYPTEGVFGLGCLPDNVMAVQRLLAIKARDAGKGLILLSANRELLDGWVDESVGDLVSEGDHAVTWIVPAGPRCHRLLTGNRSTVAVRITRHPICRNLSAATARPLVSTSANHTGEPAIVSKLKLQRQLAHRVDYVVPGDLGGQLGPSEIRDLLTGTVLRPLSSE